MAEASGSGERQLPDFGSDNKPNQHPQFDFPKREFGKTKPVKRAFQAQWFMKWKWLHYDCSRDLVFCHICISALKGGMLKRSVGNISACLNYFIEGNEHRIKIFGGFK